MSDMTLVDSPIGQELSLAELLGFGADESRSIADLIFAAKNGDSASMSVLGEKYLKGVDVERNIAKGLYWLAESEDERSWNEIGSFYDKEKDLDRAEEWYLKEVEKNGPYSYQGMNALCLTYLRPEKLDLEKAEQYLVRSLEAMENLPERMKNKEGYLLYQNTLLYGAAGLLGFYYSKLDPLKAVYWLSEEQTKRISEKPEKEQKLMVKALAESYNKLFFMENVPQETLDEGAELLEPIAEQMGADYVLGISAYYTNRKHETEKYFYWKGKAAELEDLGAQVQLAAAYMGESYDPELAGVEMDPERARKYIALAKGNTKADKELYEKWRPLLKQAVEWVTKEENKAEKHFTAKEGRELVKKMGSTGILAIPEGYTHIDSGAFSGLDKKVAKACKEVWLPETVRVIESHAFSDTYKLEKVKLPQSLRFVGARAFDTEDYVSKGGFTMLLVPMHKLIKSLTIPAYAELEITRMDGKTYNPLTSGFCSIDKLTFEEGRTEIYWDYFNDISVWDMLYIPDSVQTIRYYSSDIKFKAKHVSMPAHLKDQITKLSEYEAAGCQFTFRGEK